jgi:hypothetical protein
VHVSADANTCIYNDNDVANHCLLVKHETPLNVSGVFHEIFNPKHAKAIGNDAAADR